MCVTNSAVGAALTRAGFARRGAADCAVIVGDAQQLAYPAAADLALFLESSHLMGDKSAAFGCAAAALRARGRVAVTDLVALEPGLDFSPRELAVLHSIFGHIAVSSAAEYVRLLGRAGFGDIAVHDVSAAAAPTLTCWQASCAAAASRLARVWPAGRIRRFHHACALLDVAFRERRAGYVVIHATRV